MDCAHSQYCEENNNSFKDTILDINKEVNYYKTFRKYL